MALYDRANIRNKVRRITRKVSANEVTDTDINDAIDVFLLYDFPEILRLFDLRRTFSFFTSPNIEQYYTNTDNMNDPLYNFKNAIVNSHTPVYVGGFKAYFTQSRDEFFRYWNQVQQKVTIGTGDGVTTNFSGTLDNIPVQARSVLFTSVDATGLGQQLQDVPLVSAVAGQEGSELINGNLYDPRGAVPTAPTVVIAANTINYVTGVYNITFTVAPAAGELVEAQVIPYQAARPTAVLYFDNTFTVRPIPDNSYEIKIEANVRPSALVSDTDGPNLEQQWQFIAYGAAIKILQDLTDLDTVEQLMPEFERQKIFVLRNTLNQMEDTRAETLFSQPGQRSGRQGWWWSNY